MFDPFAPLGERPLALAITPGDYPVAVTRASELFSIWFNDKPAVRWEPAKFEDGGPLIHDDGIYGYTVNSGTGCFVDADAADDLTTLPNQDEWFDLGWHLEGAMHLFYIDLSNPKFVELTNRLIETERLIRRISGWRETLTGTKKERIQQRFGLFREFKSFGEYLDHITHKDPRKLDEIGTFIKARDRIIEELNSWTKAHAFNDQEQPLLARWRTAGQYRENIFRHFKLVTFPDGRRNAAVFQTAHGDGEYPSFWAYDWDGAVCRLTTDFEGHWTPESEETQD